MNNRKCGTSKERSKIRRLKCFAVSNVFSNYKTVVLFGHTFTFSPRPVQSRVCKKHRVNNEYFKFDR